MRCRLAGAVDPAFTIPLVGPCVDDELSAGPICPKGAPTRAVRIRIGQRETERIIENQRCGFEGQAMLGLVDGGLVRIPRPSDL